MPCGHIQSSPASASRRLDATTEDYHFSYISQFLIRRVVIECISSLAYSNLISCSPAPTSRSSLPALTPPATSGRIPQVTILITQFLAVTPAHFDLLQTLQTTWSRSSTCWPRPHLDNSLPLAPSDQFELRQFAAGFWLDTLSLPRNLLSSTTLSITSCSRAPVTRQCSPPVSCLVARHHCGLTLLNTHLHVRHPLRALRVEVVDFRHSSRSIPPRSPCSFALHSVLGAIVNLLFTVVF